MIPEYFVIVGAVIGFLGGISYLIDTLKGKVKPNRVSWFLWAVVPLIAFFAELDEGVGIQSLMTFIVGFNPLLIFIASFMNKEAEWKLTRLAFICGAFAVLGILLWSITQVGIIAIIFSILADGIAAIPTLVKSWKEPETESYTPFATSAVTGGLTLLTIRTWDFAHYAFPVYIFLICVVLAVIIKFKLGKQRNGPPKAAQNTTR